LQWLSSQCHWQRFYRTENGVAHTPRQPVVTLKCFVTDWRVASPVFRCQKQNYSSQVNDGVWLIREEIQGSLGRGMAWTMRVVVVVSLVSGIVGLLLAMQFYVLQEIFAGLLTVAVLLAVGVLLVVVFVSLREVWQYCLQWAMNARSARAGRHKRRDSPGGALLGDDSQQGRSPRSRRAA
jgi:hypothetical protein